MSRYGWSRSPYSSQANGIPTVTEDDYTYITSQDPDMLRFAKPSGSRQHRQVPNSTDDVLLIENRGITYPTHFPAYSIDDGTLLVSDVAECAGRMMNLFERKSRSLRFLFNGHQLKTSSAPVRDYGVRNRSVIMAVIPDDDDRGDESDDELVVVDAQAGGSGKNKRRRRKRGGKSGRGGAEDDSSSQRDRTSNAGAKSPTPAPGAAGQRRINELSNEFTTKWLPLCKAYIASPPTDALKRKDEHTRLSETVLQHVLLKLDEVDTEGNQDVRQSRKGLVRTVTDVLKQLDVACGPVDGAR